MSKCINIVVAVLAVFGGVVLGIAGKTDAANNCLLWAILNIVWAQLKMETGE